MRSKVLVLLPCYRRPEYTAKCIKAIEAAQEYTDTTFYMVNDGSMDETTDLFIASTLPKRVELHYKNQGLRNIIIEFFKYAKLKEAEFIVKMDNDCLVPKDWLKHTIDFLSLNVVDIVSPNVLPSNAAFKHGKEDKEGLGYRPSKIVGGLWAMRREMIDDIDFEKFESNGITGAWQLLNQIIVEKEPRIGWLPDITVQDIGHWTGEHPEHIASEDHREYSVKVGRRIAW